MKNLSLLKTLTKILFVLCLIGIFFYVPFILMVAVFPESVPVKINGEAATTTTVETLILMLALGIGFAFFTYALYLFKNVLELFQKKKIFHDDVIKNFNQIGKAIIIGYFIMVLSYVGYCLAAQKLIEISAEGFNQSILTVGLGLFFMVLSEVFLMAKNIKEENDLTV
ncbi:DUF2975 domain-containing protein [Flavobacterium subsaxonicum]|uniref:DUF2975 domain-containing protein n=1 Tax=Flavobacterium subsaxonicum TaxID=426226 RepID=UPI00040676BC|nr:DUF2975 domain-containing protein [Flavobacterium subsaxonicum]